jgi:glycine dehydrogenase
MTPFLSGSSTGSSTGTSTGTSAAVNWNQATEAKDRFERRHLGSEGPEVHGMLKALGYPSMDAFLSDVVPSTIRFKGTLDLPAAAEEKQALDQLRSIAKKNQLGKFFIGNGYHDCFVPPVIQRNILENPGWYTQYTPYQAEIAQGRLEALLNFQTMVSDLTGMELSNASLLDEGTAAAEAMGMCFSSRTGQAHRFFVSKHCHPQTIAVLQTRAEPLGIELTIADESDFRPTDEYFGLLVQYPDTRGKVTDFTEVFKAARAQKILTVVAADLLALVLLKSPGEMGADIAVGTAQRFGVPMGFGGPHAGYLSTRSEFSRKIPGRMVGVSKDSAGNPAIRLALQTREQHIRRDKATSNICTAQVLLAVMSGMYAVYHGPEGLRRIARRVHGYALLLAASLKSHGLTLATESFFDTVWVADADCERVKSKLQPQHIHLRYEGRAIGMSLDETTRLADIDAIAAGFGVVDSKLPSKVHAANTSIVSQATERCGRKSDILKHEVFRTYASETEMLRYIRRLESRDLSLTHSMIPLGSCTMKLNATSELFPVTWPEFGSLHPFAPSECYAGYRELFADLEKWLAVITGFDGVSLQPNSGAQGEYAGLLVIRSYLASRGMSHRDVCLIPKSAHGTNPASAVMAGFRVVGVECDAQGNIDFPDLVSKAAEHADKLAAMMLTYPSTHGVFEENVSEICEVIHRNGGQVYMDGANLNAQVGLCRPAHFGPDVCHINLHKTFCIPHGGGGPGMGPICVKAHLSPFLPNHPLQQVNTSSLGPVSAAPWGSASILPISWMYIRMMGGDGLRRASELAILNANYMAHRLKHAFPVVYSGNRGRVAHECIIDLRPLKKSAGIEVEDVAKRLMDYGFHAPTISWPVAGTMMIEPTESESVAELDRFVDALLAIREEVAQIERGEWPKDNNPLKHAPHTCEAVLSDAWSRPYTREQAAFPVAWVRGRKFWPAVGRVDNVYGDRNLFCSCPPPDWEPKA